MTAFARRRILARDAFVGRRALSRVAVGTVDERVAFRCRVLSAGRVVDARDRVLYAGADGNDADDCAARRRRRRAAVAVDDGIVAVGDVFAVLKGRWDLCMGGVGVFAEGKRRDGFFDVIERVTRRSGEDGSSSWAVSGTLGDLGMGTLGDCAFSSGGTLGTCAGDAGRWRMS